MRPLERLRAVACALPRLNVDTDQILPARFMKEPRRPPVGYARFLFHDIRRDATGGFDPAFPLNAACNANAQIIAARRNFGSGSSREAAVYALVDSGIRCILAPSHGDIFSANAVNNGVLPARMDEADMENLLARLAPGGIEVDVDLQACVVHVGQQVFRFHIDPIWRIRLLNAWDEIHMTRQYAADIAAWCAHDAALRPWASLPSHPTPFAPPGNRLE